MQFQPFSPKQKLVQTWWCRRSTQNRDGILCDGAVRSGKTLCMGCGFLLWSMSCFDGATFALCGHTIESLRRNLTVMLPRWLEGVFRFEEHRSENRIRVWDGGRRNDFYLFGGKDESSAALIQGITLAGVLLDEVTLMPRSFVDQALARCSVAGSKFWFNCNPAGTGHWFYREWVCRAEERNLLRLPFGMDDNPSLAPDVRARYERLYTGLFYDRYILGRWAAAEGVVYDMFRRERNMPAELPETRGRCWISVDYGTLNPTVFLKWRRAAEGDVWVCEAEYFHSGREERAQKTDREYADDLVRFLDGERPRGIVADPSAASFIAELRRRGLPVRRADNEVEDGVRRVSARLREGTLLFSQSCRRTEDEFGSYVWDETAARRGEDRPRKEHDHAMDAVRYFVTTVADRQTVHPSRRPFGL